MSDWEFRRANIVTTVYNWNVGGAREEGWETRQSGDPPGGSRQQSQQLPQPVDCVQELILQADATVGFRVRADPRPV